MDDLLIIFIVALIFLLLAISFGSKKANYDERQELIRGKGFKYGFLTIVLVDALLAVVVRKIQLAPQLLVLTPLFIGLWVFSIYVLWNSAYFAMNQKRRKYWSWLLLLYGLLDGAQSITSLMRTSGSLRVWDPDVGLLMLAIYCVSVGGSMVYCIYRDQDK